MKLLLVFLSLLLLPLTVSAHPGTLDAYGCHSNKILFGTTAKRECHADLLAGQVFSSTTAEYKAYIAEQKKLLSQLQTELATCKAQVPVCPPPPIQPMRLVISWNPNKEADLAAYKVYCGPASGNYNLTKIIPKPATLFILEAAPGTYFCRIAAINTAGMEGPMSNEVTMSNVP